MSKGDFFFQGPKLIDFSESCLQQRRRANELKNRLMQANYSDLGENDSIYMKLIHDSEKLIRYFDYMYKAAVSIYENAEDASRQIHLLIETHQDAMRNLQNNP